MSYFNVASGIVIAGLVAMSARGALAQSTSETSTSAPSTGGMVVGGILGGVAGFMLGTVAGTAVDHNILHRTQFTQSPRWGAAVGAGIGTTVGIALGVHAFNSGQGRFMPVLGRTAATIAGFWAGSYAANRIGAGGVDDLMILAGVGAGIYMAQRTERSTTPITLVSISVPTP